MKKLTAISYLRFSTPEQIKGDSVRRQTAATEAYCAKHGLTLTDAYRLKDLGKSAYHGVNRSDTGALGQFLKAVESGKIQKGTVLIVESLDRISRQEISKALPLFMNLINAGIEIVTLSDNERRYSEASVNANPMEIMTSIMVMMRANEESRMKSYRAKESWKNKHEQAKQGKVIKTRLPCWIDRKNSEYVLVTEKVKTIERIFKMFLEGYGTYIMAKMFTTEKVPMISRAGGNGKWNPTSIQRLIKSKELLGHYMKVDPPIPDYFPRVVSDTDFYAAQAKMKTNKQHKGQRMARPALFTNLLKCARCGGGVAKNSGNYYQYYQCYTSRIRNCDCATLPQYVLETSLLHTIKEAQPSAVQASDKAALQEQQELAALQGQIEEVTGKLRTAKKLFLANPSEAGSEILAQLEADKKALTAQHDEKRNAKFLVDHRGDWKQVKGMLENLIVLCPKHNKLGLTIIPLSVVKEGAKLRFFRHEDAQPETIIAVRESLRQHIESVAVDFPGSKATIHFKTGKKITIEYQRNNTYRRVYSYRVGKAAWQEIETPMQRTAFGMKEARGGGRDKWKKTSSEQEQLKAA